MDNRTSLETVKSAGTQGRFTWPLYQSYCFSNIPGAIASLTTGESWGRGKLPPDVLEPFRDRYDQVVLFFVDALGWRLMEHCFEHDPPSWLLRLREQGHCSKLTALFPSTTAVHLTNIHTGLTTAETGVLEWFYYDAKVDNIISPLLYSYGCDAGIVGRKRDTLVSSGVSADELFPASDIYPFLKDRGVHVEVVQPAEYTYSAYNSRVIYPALNNGYHSWQGGLQTLAERVNEASGPSYFFYYWGEIDSRSHTYGPFTAEVRGAVKLFFDGVEEFFINNLKTASRKKTLLLFTADHGQEPVSDERTVYLDRDVPEIVKLMRRNKQGEILAPGGSPRVYFPYIHSDKVPEAIEILRDKLDGRADVVPSLELIERGLYGGNFPSNRFTGNMGELTILPYENECVMWLGADERYRVHGYGAHGGLLPNEMEIPLLAFEI